MSNHTSSESRQPVSVLVLSGSLRSASLNTKLAAVAEQAARARGARAELCTMAEFETPAYSQDRQEQAFPDGAQRLRDRLEAHDALMLASPEYNFSMPGALKNTIDWVSRYRPHPFTGRHALLMSASPSMVGGNRGLWALRVPLEHLGMHVYPEMFSLARAGSGFAEDGGLADDQLAERFRTTVASFLDLVEAHKHYGCAKDAWIEFIGEPEQPVT